MRVAELRVSIKMCYVLKGNKF